MKLRWIVALVATMGMGSVVAQETASEKGRLSYAIGYEIGRDFTTKKMDVDIATVIKAMQDGYAKRNPSVPEEQMRTALETMQKKMLDQAKADFERVAGENKRKSDAFLAANKAKPGVTTLPSGIQYRVIEPGSGAKPTASSEVQIHFRGSLASGQEFASTYTGNQPVTMKVADAPIPGLKAMLPMIPIGGRYELFLPSEQAYGNTPRSPIGPNQAVVFDVKVISIK
jgi:FKBP-type peptidyl-prolyl cis-trans isomerase